jgi:RimJ/RimL family protein N-acetyltransferase
MRFDRLETPRLVIRRLSLDDLAPFVAYRALPEVERWQLWENYDLERGRKLITETLEKEPFTANDWFQFGVEHKASRVLIGDLYVKMDEAGQQAELGWTFDTAHQGQGLATEAASALMAHAFGARKLHRLYAITDPRHERSWKLMLRLGMRQEAHMRENLWFKGAWADDVIYAILEREWAAGRGF